MGGSTGVSRQPASVQYRKLSLYARNINHDKKNGVNSWTGHIWIGLEGYGTYGMQPNGLVSESPQGADYKVCFKVTDSELKSAYDAVQSFKSAIYLISGDSCIGFVVKVARAAGLSCSSDNGWITQPPASYLADIYTDNLNKSINCN